MKIFVQKCGRKMYWRLKSDKFSLMLDEVSENINLFWNFMRN